MRTTCRLILGISVFVAAAGLALAQQPDPQPPPAPFPETQVTPAPMPPDAVPPAEPVTTKLLLQPIPTAPDPVVTSTSKPVKKVSSTATKKPAQATASKKPIEKPAPPEISMQAKEAAAAGSVTSSDSFSPPPPPAAPASPALSPKAPAAVDPVVQAEIDKKLADAAQRKKTVGGRIIVGFGLLALIGLAVYFVRSRNGVSTLPPIYDGGVPAQATALVVPSYPVGGVRHLPK